MACTPRIDPVSGGKQEAHGLDRPGKVSSREEADQDLQLKTVYQAK